MIFKQWREVLEGRKTQTRRIVKSAEWCCALPWYWSPSEQTFAWADTVPPIIAVYTGKPKAMDGGGITKWEVGRTYAVTPKRGEASIWWQECVDRFEYQQLGKNGWDHADELEDAGYQQMRILITDIRLERLQDISEADAIAEGYPYQWPPDPMQSYVPELHPAPIAWYRQLWDSINNRAGMRWEDNPMVWVLDFELVQ